MPLNLPTSDDPLTTYEQDKLFARLECLRDSRPLLQCEVENILRMAVTLLFYRKKLAPGIDSELPRRVTRFGIDLLETI
ncbi:MAG: hypothetical protein IMZ55_15100 [Acidobacteria bacterium]|nr:hypothetical protein [Acidobacteriota bacterium]